MTERSDEGEFRERHHQGHSFRLPLRPDSAQKRAEIAHRAYRSRYTYGDYDIYDMYNIYGGAKHKSEDE